MKIIFSYSKRKFFNDEEADLWDSLDPNISCRVLTCMPNFEQSVL